MSRKDIDSKRFRHSTCCQRWNDNLQSHDGHYAGSYQWRMGEYVGQTKRKVDMKSEITKSQTAEPEPVNPLSPPKLSGWKCYLFGSTKDNCCIIWKPSEGCVPNMFVRFFMKVFFGSTWTKPPKQTEEKFEVRV